ncbi:MAG: class I SAM-dependent methyltransferase [Pseudomonadota bacterium]
MAKSEPQFMPARFERITKCRACGADKLTPFLDLGVTPFADRLVELHELHDPEPAAPLTVAFCEGCSLVQILDTVEPEDLFDRAYPYYSSFSPALLDHSRENVLDIIDRRTLDESAFVIELASNDGYLLKNYVDAGMRVLGIDPAPGPVAAAEEAGVSSMLAFFTEELADRVAGEHGRADVIHANNVLAHVADTNGFVAGISKIVKDDGVVVIEAPYVRDLIDHVEFDTIYHEHLLYLSVTAVDHLFRRHGLYLNDVKHLSIHGGSLRYYFEPQENVGKAVKTLLREEDELGVNTIKFYTDFSSRVDTLRSDLKTLLISLKEKGASIAAYGAAAKGATMINCTGLDTSILDFVVDRNTHKQGKYMPGGKLPVLPPEALVERKPDYALMLAWNFADEIMRQQTAYREQGGKFIIPVPKPRIV